MQGSSFHKRKGILFTTGSTTTWHRLSAGFCKCFPIAIGTLIRFIRNAAFITHPSKAGWLPTALTTVAFLFFLSPASAQKKPPFIDEIKNFKKLDSITPPPKDAILFTGSSSFRLWANVQDYFQGYPIVNRAFGGSTLNDVIFYADEAIIAYQPKQILIYCGDNDLAGSDTVSANTVYERFVTLYDIIKKSLPQTQVTYVSIKPSPSRERLIPKVEEANKLIQQFLSKQKNTAFIDVYHAMLTAEGKPDKNLFINDMLHMNLKGYAIWQAAIRPYLAK